MTLPKPAKEGESSLMETAVSITTKLKVSVDDIDLSIIYGNRNQESICKTCVHEQNRGWKVSTKDIFEAALAGEDVQAMSMCVPTQNDVARKAVATTTFRKVIPLDAPSDDKIIAFIDSCGHQTLPKCNGCERFKRDYVEIPYADEQIFWKSETNDGVITKVPYTKSGKPVKTWRATIGGYCSIGPEGIVKDNKVTHCDPIKREIAISPSCSNCAFLDRVGDSWMYDHLSVNANARLTPFEYYEAYMQALRNGEDPTAATNIALYLKQIKGQGRILTLKARIENCYSVLATQETRYLVRYDRSPVVDKISSTDDSIKILSIDNKIEYMIVEVTDNRLRSLKYSLPLVKYNLIWPQLPKALNLHKDKAVDPRIVKECAERGGLSACSYVKNRPCYYHSKRPTKNEITGEISFEPTADKTHDIFPPNAYMHIEKIGGKYYAVDDECQMPMAYSETQPNASVFRKWLPTLLQNAKAISTQAVKDIESQYRAVISGLQRSTIAQKVRPYWLAPSTLEPAKPRCTHPDGMDLRKVFGDTFGLERVDFDFDLGSMNTIEVEEEIRVGYRQHEQTPQHLQEEVLTNMMLDPNYVHAVGGKIDPDKPINIEGFSITELPLSDSYDNTKDFVNSLDDHIETGVVTSQEDQTEVNRYITRREQLFGYSINGNVFGKRKPGEMTQLLSKDPGYVVFGDSYDFTTSNVSWVCLKCDKKFDYQSVDIFNPLCDNCENQPLHRNHNAREVVNPRARGGVGNAYVKASPSLISSMQLGANLCDKWVYREIASGINYETLFGSGAKVIQSQRSTATAALDVEIVEIVKVNKITPEQLEANRLYAQLVDSVVSQREEYLAKNPSASAKELARLYPTPPGKVYQEKVAGSLSKMGGSASSE